MIHCSVVRRNPVCALALTLVRILAQEQRSGQAEHRHASIAAVMASTAASATSAAAPASKRRRKTAVAHTGNVEVTDGLGDAAGAAAAPLQTMEFYSKSRLGDDLNVGITQ